MLKNKNILYLVSVLFLISIVSGAFLSGVQIKLKTTGESGFDRDEVWVVSFVDDGFTTDSVNAYFDEADIEDESGEKPKQGFKLDIDTTKNKCQYDINRETNRQDILTFDVVEEDFWSWEYSDALDSKNSDFFKQNCWVSDDYTGGFAGVFKEGILTDTLYCWKQRDNLGKIGSLKNLKYITESEWSVKVDGKAQYTEIISNSETGSGRTTNLGPDVKIQWQGLLSSGDTCPLTDTELMAYSTNFPSNWRVIDRFNYNNYENFVRSNMDTEMSNYVLGRKSKSSIETLVNNKASKAIEERDFSGFTPIISSTSLNNGVLQVNLDRLIRFPLFRIFIDSDYLELEIQTGVPQVECPTGTQVISEGDLSETSIPITVKNIGSGEGGFNLRVKSCDANFQAGDNVGFTLQPNEQDTYDLNINAQTQAGKDVFGSCLIELKESFTQKTDTCTVNLKATKPEDCTDGRIWCSYDGEVSVIKACEDGVEKIIKRCKSGEICDSDQGGVPVCRGDDDGDEDCGAWLELGGYTIIPDIFCYLNNFLKKFIITFAIVFGTLGGLLAGWLSNNVALKNKKFKDKWYILLIVALIAGGLVGYLTYVYWYIALLLLVLFGIIKMFV